MELIRLAKHGVLANYWLAGGCSGNLSLFWDGLSELEFCLTSWVGTTTAGGAELLDSAGTAGITTGFDFFSDFTGGEFLGAVGELFSTAGEEVPLPERDVLIARNVSTREGEGETLGAGAGAVGAGCSEF